jgi:hypothetical protein
VLHWTSRLFCPHTDPRAATVAALLLGVSLAAAPAVARADRVYLTSGSVIEGKAQRVGEKVTVEMESGTLTLSAGSVQRIERAESDVERVDARLAALAPNDVQGLLLLADYCRDHDMKSREQELLRKVIELSPDHAEARARLGYVRSDGGWITRDEQMRAQGFVKRGDRWLTQEQFLAMQRLEAETRTAQLERDRAQVELDAKRAELASEKARDEARARKQELDELAARNQQSYGMAAYYGPYGYAYGGYGYPALYPGRGRGPHAVLRPNPTPGPGGPAPSPIPGFRDPSNMSFQVPGYQDPRNYFR